MVFSVLILGHVKPVNIQWGNAGFYPLKNVKNGGFLPNISVSIDRNQG